VFQADILKNKMLHLVLTSVGTLIFIVVAMFHVVFLYNWRWLFRRADCTKIDLIPGPKQVPFFGNIFLLKQPEGGKCLVISSIMYNFWWEITLKINAESFFLSSYFHFFFYYYVKYATRLNYATGLKVCELETR
jgi:hypothetical protein